MKRFLSILLCSAILAAAIPGMYYAEGNQSSYDELSQLKEIDYQLNGGHYVSGYNAPDKYPAEQLPDKDDIVNQGYEFGGWYDNKELTGSPVTEISEENYTGVVVLYAKWIERYYYIDIPESVDADKTNLTVSGHAGGLYEKDKVSVSVYSKNEWNLLNGDVKLGYELYNEENKLSLTNNSVITELTATGSDKTRKYMTRLQEIPKYAGIYTDNLTFDISFETTKYNIKYETNGGTLYADDKDEQGRATELDNSVYEAGTKLSDLPVPGKAGSTFLGWCYDADCTDYVASTDRLLSDVVLYASWVDGQELKTVSIDTYARSYDVDANDFTITVTDKSGRLTKEEVKNKVSVKNVSDSSENTSIDITAGSVLDDGAYTFIIKCNGTWQEGCGYRLELSDDRLYFTGYDQTIREYDFTVYKPDVTNVNLRDDIKYIKSGSLSNLYVNGEKADRISVTVMTVGQDGTISQEAVKTTGSFTYSDSTLNAGDKIAVYDGDVVPQLDGSAISDDDVSFFEITSAKGNEYSYRGMAAEEILFVPDVLPVNVADDKDNDPDNDSITITKNKMSYGSDSLGTGLGLDEDTTVDTGDYLALYATGNDEIQYAVITNVSTNNADYIITYKNVTWDEVQAAMDVYQTDNVSGESILQNQDISGIEQSVEQQAVDSGFAQSVVDEVAQAVVRTNSYQELQEYLSDTMDADISIVPQDITYLQDKAQGNVALYSSKKPEVKLDHVRANLSTDLKHFENVSGLRLALDIGVEISFSNMKVIVSATFEQEVKININVSGKAIWKVWGIFPYIDDYRVAVSLDLYDYTGINFNVNVRTAEEDDDDESSSKLDEVINGIAEELKNMMEIGTTYISDKSDLSTRLEDIKDSDDDSELSVAKSLAERYSDMLDDEADWVELYSKSLTESHVRVIGIIDIEFKVEFVVSANVNISMGMTYWYKNAKRYVYSIMVFDRKVTSDSIDLSEEQYEFSVYAIGTIGIRAGIRLSVAVGLISTKLASVGFTAEVGGYAQVWGYLYYQLKYAASQGRTASSMGAIYMEIGVYMEVNFLAQALSGTFSYNPTLFEKQWPLYSVGVVENVCDYAYGQESVKDIKMKRDVKTVRLPDTYFEMQYLDMKEGLDDNNEYFTKVYDDSDRYFSITMTNPAFSYDPETNIVEVNPGSEPQQDGEMIITWKSQKGSFNTKPITRKISLHWDNLRDGYYIAFQTNGGSVVDAIISKYNKVITKPEDPVKQGYTFAGWYTDEALTKKYTIPSVMPNEDRIVYAKWEAADMTYNVVDYVEGTDGVYTAASSKQETAKTDTEVSPKPDIRNGFMTPAALSQRVSADGSTTINYYYARNKYNIKFVSEGSVVSEGRYTYGTLMPTPVAYRAGYVFEGWEPAVTQTVPAKDTTYTAVWKEADDVVYTTKYYLENESGEYELDKTRINKATTGQSVTADKEQYDSRLYHLTDDLPSGTVAADGSLIFRVHYDRNSYSVSFNSMGGTVSTEKKTARWGSNVIAPVPVRAGYAFAGWYVDRACTEAFDGTMPAYDITLYAKWDVDKVNYTVEHLVEKLDGSYELYDRQAFTSDTDSQVTPDVKYMEGFSSPETETAIVKGDGSTVIRYFYKRNVHRFVLKLNNGQPDAVYDYKYGTKINIINPERTGYTFTGWDEDVAGTMPDRDVTYTAGWKINQYTISFNTDGGSEIASITQNYNTEVSFNEIPVKKGYTFTGWDKAVPDVMPAGNIVIKAQWKKDVYTISYNLNGGKADNPETYEVDTSVITLKRPQRTGYTFTGWSGTGIDGTAMDPVITTGSTGNRSYTANWKENSYVIRFIPYGDGTTGSMQDMQLMYTDEAALSANQFKRTGYTFAGWTKKAGADRLYDDNEVISGLGTADNEIITLYPAWIANEYTVHFDTKDGDAINDLVFTYDKKYELPKTSRYGYTFLGWCVEDGGTVTYKPGASADNLAGEGTVTLYASWSLNKTFTYSHPYSYRVTDDSKEEPVKLHFFIDGASGTSTSGYTRTNSIYMEGISLNEIKKHCNTMTVTISYYIKMVDDGYAEVDTTYRKDSNKSWNGWHGEKLDLKKKNKQTITHTYSIGCKDIDAICYRFDASGSFSDKYDLSNIKVSVRFD